MRDELRCIGFTAATAPSLFPCPARSSLLAVYPSPIKVSSSSFSYVSPLQSSFASSPRSRPFSPSTTCLGLLPLRDITRARPLPRGLPRPSLCSVRSLSQTLDGFLRAQACGLISSRCHVQAHPVQGLLSSYSHPSSSEGACPRAVVPARAH